MGVGSCVTPVRGPVDVREFLRPTAEAPPSTCLCLGPKGLRGKRALLETQERAAIICNC
jgi:hypothetical protein